ncbi:MAG: UbiA-like polyprenyltransferase [Bacteroidota bacterium]|nr:UbiA-like polyprenyltransferase [Bacteroidota bacterium]MDP4217707.1 UbiA-like polyprenyltransferase [Bacteroidota bacterium]MDP4246105.1 UbiA-like polyprenyltransferase [Bacteroidota bacterium]MDP4254119.1 UbiA-like polyprenyltransferase [Bacteroidota bacterium]MDP4257141.1 UbiA-like polyprenyltransferase [Bacteroidota bacterium]
MSTIKNYLSLIRFSHTIFAMPFALIGFFLGARPLIADGADGRVMTGRDIILRMVLVIGCMIFARSAAMAFNRWLDVRFDALNPRTAIREIPAGIISKSNALRFVLFSCAAFILCTWFINPLCFGLSFVALAVVLGYSYTKRFTPLCHLILGLGLSLAPIGAYLAVTGHFAVLPILFSLTVVFWVSGFDIIYALQDEDFDRSQSLYSMPAWLGKARALRVSETLHVLSTVCVIAAGVYGGFGWWYWAGVLVFGGMLIYQHLIVQPHDLSRVNLAFMTANGIASVVFAAFVIADIFLK